MLWTSDENKSAILPDFAYVQAHTDSKTLPNRLNRDLKPSMCHHPPCQCLPSQWTLTSSITPKASVKVTLSLLYPAQSFANKNRFSLPLLATRPSMTTTPHPYTHTPSTYSATIQLYGRSQQLDCAHTLSTRLKAEHQPWCGLNAASQRRLSTSSRNVQDLRSCDQTQLSNSGRPLPSPSKPSASTRQNVQLGIHRRRFFTEPAVWPTRKVFYYPRRHTETQPQWQRCDITPVGFAAPSSRL
ncbi:hypothetical protein BDN70DRAFT_58459 [Pholiota conissans]|uniref:Uncharacterized protein n=1 Tax=Pholiota conissans TaxID=109636 RepID=A0A9P6D017_9AGAR|nr:hypothetical protein BDN70DRAFT_58459 [Pholiota conissans]